MYTTAINQYAYHTSVNIKNKNRTNFIQHLLCMNFAVASINATDNLILLHIRGMNDYQIAAIPQHTYCNSSIVVFFFSSPVPS